MKRLLAITACLAVAFLGQAAVNPPPLLRAITSSNGTHTIQFTPAPAADSYSVWSSGDLNGPFTNDTTAGLNGTRIRATNAGPMKFYSLAATPMSTNALFSANLLNRIAFGPTPGDLDRLAQIGPQAYLAEQLAPEGVTDTLDLYSVQRTNSAPFPPVATWRNLTVTGFFSSSNLYVYLTQPGEVFLDDISLLPLHTVISSNLAGTNLVFATNFVPGGEVVLNGGFENPALTPPWNVTANVIGSSLSTLRAHSGNQSLRLVSAAAGTTQGDSLNQNLTNLTFNFTSSTQRCLLSFWYWQGTNSSLAKIRLGGSGINGSGSDLPPAPEWRQGIARGRSSAAGAATLYLFLNGAGTCYIDDIKMVAGTVPESGANLIRNGDFEVALHSNNWNFTADFTNSSISQSIARSGSGSLRLVATGPGDGGGDSVFQTNIPGIVANGTYTVSFWYTLPSNNRQLITRMSGSATVGLLSNAVPSGTSPDIAARLDSFLNASPEDGSVTVNTIGGASLHDLRAWFIQHCVGDRRQLLQVLLQFLENHFVTQHAKSVDYFDRHYDNGNLMDVLATEWEYREQTKWRNALLDPNCTFHDLLRISAESPAMIVYLDSVDSNGSGNNIANENYAREIMELFCMGVDNGYDQQDITVMSRSWSGWSVDIVDPWNVDNPLAAKTARVGFYPGAGSTGNSNLVGKWTFNFKSGQHGTNRAPVWCVWNTNATNPRPLDVKRVPARFGAPWAGLPYNLYPTNAVPVRTGAEGIQDARDVLAAIANLPFTMEYISVKLCRLFIHDDFVHGVYDYTDPNRSAEAELIRQCLVAWNTPAGDGRRGNIRAILSVILNSELFRSHGGSMQKVKTPLEFAVSTIRALQGTNAAGGYHSFTDGYSIAGRSRTPSTAPLTRMGSMMLFDRDAPDGFPEDGPPWISAGTLAERVRFVQATLMAATETNKNDGIAGGNFNQTDPVGLLKSRLAPGAWNEAGAVADLFLGLIYPGEGRANLDEMRSLAVNFLNTADDNSTSSPLAALGNTSAAYDTRVRALVSMLMTLPRFQEQ